MNSQLSMCLAIARISRGQQHERFDSLTHFRFLVCSDSKNVSSLLKSFLYLMTGSEKLLYGCCNSQETKRILWLKNIFNHIILYLALTDMEEGHYCLFWVE